MGGAPLQTNDLQIDGGTNNTLDLRVAYNPPEDAVAEVKVESLRWMRPAAIPEAAAST